MPHAVQFFGMVISSGAPWLGLQWQAQRLGIEALAGVGILHQRPKAGDKQDIHASKIRHRHPRFFRLRYLYARHAASIALCLEIKSLLDIGDGEVHLAQGVDPKHQIAAQPRQEPVAGDRDTWIFHR
jgi:hypothetical protein